VLRAALERVDGSLVRPLPFNSGCFALLELGDGLDAEDARRVLLERHDTGLIAIGRRHLRIAFCSVAAADLPELVDRLQRGPVELRDRRPG
jgi:hypothetical protein